MAADVFIRSQRQQQLMQDFLDEQCRAVGARFVGWRCAEAPVLNMPAGVASSLRWLVVPMLLHVNAAADAVLLVRPDLTWSKPLPLPPHVAGHDICMLW